MVAKVLSPPATPEEGPATSDAPEFEDDKESEGEDELAEDKADASKRSVTSF